MLLNRSDLITMIDEIVNSMYNHGRTSHRIDVNKLETLLPSQVSDLVHKCSRNGRINRILLIQQLEKFNNLN
jgi:hypothetical protein